jgi:hypothetical protein
VLDVGVGTATALVYNKEILERKNIVVVGIDYEQVRGPRSSTRSLWITDASRSLSLSLSAHDAASCATRRSTSRRRARSSPRPASRAV